MKKWLSGVMIVAAFAGVLGTVRNSSAEEKKSWTDTLKVYGDLRLRFEMIDEDGKDERNRGRLRARLGVSGAPSEELDVHFRLATNVDGDPVSTNTTLGDGMGGKEIALDRGYFDWHPTWTTYGESHVFGGKMANPFIAPADLLWDFDLNPEGGAVSQSVKLGDSLKLIGIGSAFQVQERSSEAETNLFGGQLALEAAATQKTKLLVGGGYYSYTSLQGKPTIWSSTSSFGNTTTSDEEGNLFYASNFGEMEFFGKLSSDIGLPVAAYVDFVNNTKAETDLDTGWMVGATLGKASEPNSWQLDYNFRELEADAVLGLLTDSDSFGGGTNGRGHKVSALYQLTKAVQAAITVFADKKNISASERDYTRTQFDVSVKF